MNPARAAALSAAVAVSLIAGALLVGRFWKEDRSLRAVDDRSIVMLGDSITAEGDWSGLFADLPIVNAGRSGFTTAELVSVAGEVAAGHPRLLLILTGTNDIRDQREPSWTRSHLEELIGVVQLTSPTTRIVVQTILPRADRPTEVIATNEAIRSLASDKGVDVIDLYADFDDGNGGLRRHETSDGVHLSDAGYERWAVALQSIMPSS